MDRADQNIHIIIILFPLLFTILSLIPYLKLIPLLNLPFPHTNKSLYLHPSPLLPSLLLFPSPAIHESLRWALVLNRSCYNICDDDGE